MRTMPGSATKDGGHGDGGRSEVVDEDRPMLRKTLLSAKLMKTRHVGICFAMCFNQLMR